MRHRTIKNLMTTDVLSVDEHTDFKEIARLLAVRDVSALPVVDGENRVVGVVSISDLLAKQGQFEQPGVLARIGSSEWHTTKAKAAGTTAAAVMTNPAITINAESTVVHGARLLEQHDIHQLPVVDETGRLVGIVSRKDLLSVFLRPDEDILGEVTHDVFEHSLGVTVNPTTVDISVRDGAVLLDGELETKSLIAVAEAMVRRVDGVVDVRSRLRFARDDTRPSLADVPMVGATRLPKQPFWED